MTNKIFLFLFIGMFLISFVSAGGIGKICIDLDAPTWPENSTLILTSSGMNIQLSWTNATDVPECSGIDHYEIYRGFNSGNLSLIKNTSDISYSDDVQDYGTYTYIIHAIDKIEHRESDGISNSITISKSSGSSAGGGGGGGTTSFWQCGEWSVCSDEGSQMRICEDLKGYEANRTESRTCIPSFIPEETGSEEETPAQPAENKGLFATMTGAVIGTLGKGGTSLAAIFAFLIIAGFIAVAVNRRKA